MRLKSIPHIVMFLQRSASGEPSIRVKWPNQLGLMYGRKHHQTEAPGMKLGDVSPNFVFLRQHEP